MYQAHESNQAVVRSYEISSGSIAGRRPMAFDRSGVGAQETVARADPMASCELRLALYPDAVTLASYRLS